MSNVTSSRPVEAVRADTGHSSWHWLRPEYAISLLIVIALLAWAEYAARAGLVSRLVLPAPSRVWAVLVEGFATGFYVEHILSTVTALISGFLIAGTAAITIAGVLSSIPFIERIMTPYLVAFQSMPKVAIAPLIVIWFGFGNLSKIIIVITACFFPILMNALHGLKLRDRDHYELMRSLGATRMQLFVHLRLPHAVPYIFAGLHIGIIFALIGTVVAEFVGTSAGIGYVMLQAKANFDLPSVYACLVLLMVLGVTLHAIMSQLERRIVFWARDLSRVSA